MKRASAYITALSGSVLLTLTLGVLALIMVFLHSSPLKVF